MIWKATELPPDLILAEPMYLILGGAAIGKSTRSTRCTWSTSPKLCFFMSIWQDSVTECYLLQDFFLSAAFPVFGSSSAGWVKLFSTISFYLSGRRNYIVDYPLWVSHPFVKCFKGPYGPLRIVFFDIRDECRKFGSWGKNPVLFTRREGERNTKTNLCEILLSGEKLMKNISATSSFSMKEKEDRERGKRKRE